MKTLLPIPDWWFFHVEGCRAPWDVTGTYSDTFLFSVAFRCFLRREQWKEDRYSEILKCVKDSLNNTEDDDTLAALVIAINVKWNDLVDYFTDIDEDLNDSNTVVNERQPFVDVLFVDLPDRCVQHIATGRVINPRKPPIDLQ